jgi:exodeoxyribonuclease-3
MRIATWNVNSLKVRLPRVMEWLEYAKPDVLCMQETKCKEDTFPYMDFQTLGYDGAQHGAGQWNGVGLISRVGLEDVVTGFTDDLEEDAVESRAMWATCGGVRVGCLYVPNGRTLDDPHYQYKLEWLGRLNEMIARDHKPQEKLVICGDFNIAPTDLDVWNPKKYIGTTHTSDAERKQLQTMLDWGLVDSFRQIYPEDKVFSWWDYRAGDFHNGRGMRIDLMLTTKALTDHLRYALIDRNARKGKLPSDHAPMFIDVDV